MTDDELEKKKRRWRNLTQYRDMTDEEYEEFWARKLMNAAPSKELETRIETKLKQFEEDYDTSDMKVNDKLTLRSLIQAIIQLEDIEQALYKIRSDGIEPSKMSAIRDMNAVMDTLRKSISQMQDDLKITRRIRKKDKEEDVINYLQDLREKAKQFYKQKMGYIFCPNCNTLLATVWFLYPDGKNKIILKCDRVLDDGEKCAGKVEISSREIFSEEKRGYNNPDIVPEGMI